MTERILKNIGSGLLAQVWTGMLGLIVLPILVRGLGPERYGLLALSLALIGFAAMADLGVGRAASKYLAEDFEKKEFSRTQPHISSALTLCIVMGVLGTCILGLLTPLLVDRILRVPVPMVREAQIVLWITAAGLVPVLMRICFDGALAGHHRIAELSLGNMLANTLKAGLSVAAVLMGKSIIGVVLANVCVSYLHAFGLWLYAKHFFRGKVQIRLGWNREIACELVRLGLFSSSASFIAGILLLYFDRFVIAAFLPLAALGYYSTAFDITSKQCYISNPIGQAFFPVFSGKSTAGRAEFEKHYFHATRMQVVGLTGLAAMLIVFARPLLTYWISPEIALHATTVMRILTVGMLLSSYATLPYLAILVGSVSPQVCPKIFAAAFGVHVVLSILLVKFLGTPGVALAVVFAFATAFLASSTWVSKNMLDHASMVFFLKKGFAASWGVAITVAMCSWFFVRPLVHNLWMTLLALVISYAIYLAGCALFAYSRAERSYVRDMGRKVIGFPVNAPSAG